jgi:hypothetical protein
LLAGTSGDEAGGAGAGAAEVGAGAVEVGAVEVGAGGGAGAVEEGAVEVGAGGGGVGVGVGVGAASEELDNGEADAAEVGAFFTSTDDGLGTGTSRVEDGNAGDVAGGATGSLDGEATCEAAADSLVD